MSFIPGMSSLTDKVPELATPRGFLRAVITFLVVFGVALFLLLLADDLYPLAALVLQLAIYGLLHWLLRSFFHGREERRTYTDAFFGRFMPAAGLNLASLTYILLAGRSTPADAVVRLVPQWLGVLLALYLLVTAVLIAVRSVQTAGVDTLSGVYIYYPDEGQHLKVKLYEVFRHPLYAALDRTALAFGLLNGTAYSLLLAVIFVAVWHPVWFGIEERELVRRLGDPYREYKERTPAVFPQGVSGEATLWQVLTGRVPDDRPAQLP